MFAIVRATAFFAVVKNCNLSKIMYMCAILKMLSNLANICNYKSSILTEPNIFVITNILLM